jgi:hydroxymethylbilane synthase
MVNLRGAPNSGECGDRTAYSKGVRTHTIRIGSRGSQLALWQANHVAEMLRSNGHAVEIEVIRTVGDRMQDPAFRAPTSFEDGTPLDAKGIFIKEIEDALADGRIDLAVHSLKDLPTALDPRFALAAVPQRADPRDAFVCEQYWGLHMLPSGARVATTSPRRKAMLLALRPDIQFVEMRGNIDTRLRKWENGDADALVLAAAGLDRLKRTEHVHQRFAIDEVTPAPGQGALGLETRAKNHALDTEDASRDPYICEAVASLNDADASFATAAERAVLQALGGGCQLPLGAYCHATDDGWHVHAMVVSADGELVAQVVHRAARGVPSNELAAAVAETLKERGALELLQGGAVTLDEA